MSVIVRIALRYVAAALIAKGVFTSEAGDMFAADPDIAQVVEVGLGLAFSALAEAWYYLARRFGWAK